MQKGILASLLSAGVLGAGLLLPAGIARDIAVNVGVCALACGAASALALKVALDGAPGLRWSGAGSAGLGDVRAAVRAIIAERLLSEDIVQRHVARRSAAIEWRRYVRAAAGAGALAGRLEAEWKKQTAPDALRPLVDAELEKLMDSSVGGLVMMVGVDNVRPAVTAFVQGVVASLGQKVLGGASGPEDLEGKLELDRERLAADLSAEASRFLDEQLAEIDPDAARSLVEPLIRPRLGLLVVWGNVFGAVAGLGAAWIHHLYP